MPRRGNSRPSRSHDTDDYDDLSNFVWNESFDSYSFDVNFDDFGYDEQFDEFGDNPDFDEEDYEDDDMRPSHHFKTGLVKTFAVAILALILLLAGLRIWFVPSELSNYIPMKNQSKIAQVILRRTQSSHPQLYAQVRYRNANGQIQIICGYVNGDTFSMQGDRIEFAGFGVTDQASGFRWTGINGQFSAALCQPDGAKQTSQQNNTPLNGGDDDFFNFMHQTPVTSALVGTATRTISSPAITSTTPQSFDIYLNQDGTINFVPIK